VAAAKRPRLLPRSQNRPLFPPRPTTHPNPTQNIQITKDAVIKRKPVDDALADDEASWSGAATTGVACPRVGCDSSRAAFIEVQIRSADEPATLFYRCVGCGHMWRDG